MGYTIHVKNDGSYSLGNGSSIKTDAEGNAVGAEYKETRNLSDADLAVATQKSRLAVESATKRYEDALRAHPDYVKNSAAGKEVKVPDMVAKAKDVLHKAYQAEHAEIRAAHIKYLGTADFHKTSAAEYADLYTSKSVDDVYSKVSGKSSSLATGLKPLKSNGGFIDFSERGMPVSKTGVALAAITPVMAIKKLAQAETAAERTSAAIDLGLGAAALAAAANGASRKAGLLGAAIMTKDFIMDPTSENGAYLGSNAVTLGLAGDFTKTGHIEDTLPGQVLYKAPKEIIELNDLNNSVLAGYDVSINENTRIGQDGRPNLYAFKNLCPVIESDIFNKPNNDLYLAEHGVKVLESPENLQVYWETKREMAQKAVDSLGIGSKLDPFNIPPEVLKLKEADSALTELQVYRKDFDQWKDKTQQQERRQELTDPTRFVDGRADITKYSTLSEGKLTDDKVSLSSDTKLAANGVLKIEDPAELESFWKAQQEQSKEKIQELELLGVNSVKSAMDKQIEGYVKRSFGVEDQKVMAPSQMISTIDGGQSRQRLEQQTLMENYDKGQLNNAQKQLAKAEKALGELKEYKSEFESFIKTKPEIAPITEVEDRSMSKAIKQLQESGLGMQGKMEAVGSDKPPLTQNDVQIAQVQSNVHKSGGVEL